MGSLSEGLSHRDGTDLGALVVCQEQRQQHHCSHYYDLGPRGTRDRWKTRSVASLRPVRCNQVPTCQEGQGSCLWVLPLGFAFGFRLWVSPLGFAFGFRLRVSPSRFAFAFCLRVLPSRFAVRHRSNGRNGFNSMVVVNEDSNIGKERLGSKQQFRETMAKLQYICTIVKIRNRRIRAGSWYRTLRPPRTTSSIWRWSWVNRPRT